MKVEKNLMVKKFIKRGILSIATVIVAGFTLTQLTRATEVEVETSAPELPMVIYPIQIEEVNGENYFAFTSDDTALYFTQDDILTDGSKYEVGDVAYAYYSKDPEGREDTFIAVMDY